MKKTMCVLLSCAAVFAASSACFAESEPMLISPAPAAYEVSADGKVIDFGKDAPFEENGTVMVPVRKTAEALGFTVTWDGEHKGVKLDNGEVNTIIYIGTDSYYMASSTAIGMSAPESLGAAPVLKASVTYAPASLFGVLYCNENAVRVDDNRIFISKNNDSKTEIPNPFTEFDTVDEAKKALSFDAKLPSYIPEGYAFDFTSVLGKTFIQVSYKKGDDEILVRTAEEDGDISGDYNVYRNEETVKIGEYSVKLRGNDGVSNATWSDGKCAYSIYADGAVDIAEVEKIILSIK